MMALADGSQGVSVLFFIATFLASTPIAWAAPQDHPDQLYAVRYDSFSANPAQQILQLLGHTEEPLPGAALSRLLQQLSVACSATAAQSSSSSPQRQVTAQALLSQYAQGGVLNLEAIQQACTAVMACQLDATCTLGNGAAASSADANGAAAVTLGLRLAAAAGLALEAALGLYIPVALRGMAGYEWWLSLLNCFSGGVFLAAGLVHLLPHCQESQQALAHLVGDYPLYLVLITLGYLLVLFVERVLFDVHSCEGHGHGPVAHCSHTGISAPDAAAPPSEGPEGPGRGDGLAGAEAPGTTPVRRSRRLQQQQQQRQGGGDSEGDVLRSPLLAPGGDADGEVAPGYEGRSPDRDTHAGHGHGHSHSHGHAHGHAHGHGVRGPDLRGGVVLLVALSVHTFLECMALGLMSEFLMLLTAIASHKLISALALSSRFVREGATGRQTALYLGPFVLVPPSAILFGAFVRDVNPLLHLALSCFATGTFLYVGGNEIVEEEFEGDVRNGRTDISPARARWTKFAALLCGVAAIAALSLDEEGHGHTHPADGVMGGHHHHHHHHHHH